MRAGSVGRRWLLACLGLAAALAARASAADAVPWSPTTRIAGGGEVAIDVAASADAPRLLLVEQLGIDVGIECRAGAGVAGATGRLGLEAVLLDASASCKVRPQMARAAPGKIRWAIVDPAGQALGANTSQWRLYTALTQLDVQIEESRRAAIHGYAALLAMPALAPALRLQLQLALAALHRRGRDFDAAVRHYGEAAALAEEQPEWLPAIANGLGMVAIEARRFAEADAAFDRAEAQARAQANGFELATAQNNRGLVRQHLGELRHAAECYQVAAQSYLDAGEIGHRATPLYNWATVAIQLGQPEAALRALHEAREIREGGESDRSLGNVYLQLALMHVRLGDWEPTLRYGLQAERVFARLNSPGDLSRAHRIRAIALRELGEAERAREQALAALAAAERQGDARYLAQAQAELAEHETDAARAAERHLAASDLYRQDQQLPFAHREQAAAAMRLLDAGRVDEARALWQGLGQLANDDRLPQQADYHVIGARLAAALGDHAQAIELTGRAIERHRRMRDQAGLLRDQLLLAEFSAAAGQRAAARKALDAALAIHRRQLDGLPSPGLLAAREDRTLPLADALIDWHRAAGPADAQQWLRDLAALQAAPTWRFSTEYAERWRRYAYNLGRLQELADADAPAATELRSAIAADEAWLDLEFRRRPAPVNSKVDELLASLPPGSALLGVMRGSRQSLAAWTSTQTTERIDWSARTAGDALPALSPEGLDVIYAFGTLDLPALDIARLLFPGADPTRLPVVVHLVGGFPSGWQRPRLAPGYAVAGIALPDARGGLLPGAARELAWLRKHYAERLREPDDTQARPLPIPPADLVQFAAHGWNAGQRPLASALVGAPGEAARDRSSLLGAGDLRWAAAPRLIVLNACESAGNGRRPWSLAHALAGELGSVVIAPAAEVDDRAALAFSRDLHTALDGGDVIAAYAAAVRGDRARHGPRAAMPWRLLQAPRAALVGETAPSRQ
jgi:tetratricopeptide (TPR) repeat protein